MADRAAAFSKKRTKVAAAGSLGETETKVAKMPVYPSGRFLILRAKLRLGGEWYGFTREGKRLL